MLSIFLIFAVRFIRKRALDSILFQSRVQIIFAEGWSVRKMESLHQRRAFHCRVQREDAEPQGYLGRYLGRCRDRQRLLCPRHPE